MISIYSFTMCRIIIHLLTIPFKAITNMHPASKAILALFVYLFGGIPVTYAVRSANYWLGFHSGLQLSTATEFCMNLRFQAHYNVHPLDHSEELQYIWCLGEQEGVHRRPLFLYFLEVSHVFHMISGLLIDEQHSVPNIMPCSSCSSSSLLASW